MSRLVLIGLVTSLAGCFSPKFSSGQFRCENGTTCPDGYHCAVDNTCWKNGTDPMLDMANVVGNGGGSDMALPPPLSYPPAAVWISSGGGVLQQPGVALIELTISGEFAVGAAAPAANPAPSITYGYFSSLTN